MIRRTLLIRTVVAAVGSVAFTATGWLMGAGALTMSSGGYPCPPNPRGSGRERGLDGMHVGDLPNLGLHRSKSPLQLRLLPDTNGIIRAVNHHELACYALSAFHPASSAGSHPHPAVASRVRMRVSQGMANPVHRVDLAARRMG